MPDRFPGFLQQTAIHASPGAISDLPDRTKALGMRAPAVVIDQRLVPTRVGETVRQVLPSAAIVTHPTSEPSGDSILGVVNELRALNTDGIIAVGGGSSLDTGKVARALLAADAEQWQDLPEVIEGGVPLITVPTTAGTGAEVGSGALMYDVEADDKVLVRRRGMAAELALADSDLTLGLPSRLTAYTGLDALAQAILAYVPATGDSISGQIALRAIELIFANLPEAVHNGDDRHARARMMQGSIMSAIAMFNAPPTYAAEHTFAEAIGPATGIPHGHAVAAFLVPVAAYNVEPLADRYAEMAFELGLARSGAPISSAADSFVRGLEELVSGLAVEPLEQVATAWDIEDLSSRCRRHGGFAANPRPIDNEAIRGVLESAYSGRSRT